MKASKQQIAKLFGITRQELAELDLAQWPVEIAEALESFLAHRIETKSQSSLRKKMDRLRAQLYASQAERMAVSNRLLQGETILTDDYRRVTSSRIVAARSALLSIAARIAYTGQSGTASQYADRLANELEDVRVAMPAYDKRDFAPGNDLIALLKETDDAE